MDAGVLLVGVMSIVVKAFFKVKCEPNAFCYIISVSQQWTTLLLQELNKASLFDLHRIRSAIDMELSNQ